MSSRRIFSVSVLVLLLAAGSAPAVPVVQTVVDQVSQSSYTYYMTDMLYTSIGDDRGFGPEHDLARDNIYSHFAGLGLATSYEPFQYGGSTYNNIIGVHTGTTRPDEIYIIGAHFDSVNNPGADDNASGTAGVMEAARVLSQYQFEATIIFIGFDREEQGVIGSRAYAAAHAADNILGMLTLDMIAYNGSGGNQASVYGRSGSDPLKQALLGSIATYGNGLVGIDSGSLGSYASDHSPFQDEGFQACLLIEYDYKTNPYYHRPGDSTDTPDYIDYEYATNMVCSVTGFLAEYAVIIPEPATVLLLGWGWVLLMRRREI